MLSTKPEVAYVTYCIVIISTHGINGLKKGISTPPTVRSMVPFTFYGRWIGQVIIFCRWLLLTFVFFIAYSQRSQIGCLPCFHTRCGLLIFISWKLGCIFCWSLY